MANPTPGDWQVREYSIFADDRMILMSAVRFVRDEERIANLRIAAAGKDMLDTLLKVKEWLELQDDKRHNTHIRLIEATIKKATE